MTNLRSTIIAGIQRATSSAVRNGVTKTREIRYIVSISNMVNIVFAIWVTASSKNISTKISSYAYGISRALLKTNIATVVTVPVIKSKSRVSNSMSRLQRNRKY